MKFFIISIILLQVSVFSDVKSNQGQLRFDIQNDQQAEMTLNSTGLGVGKSPSKNLDVHGNAMISDQFFAGGSTGSSNVNLNGSVGYGVITATSDLTLSNQSIVLVDTTSANVTLTLPAASASNGRVYEIKRIVDNVNFLHVTASDNIDGHSNYYELAGYEDLKLVSNGTQWFNLNANDPSDSVVASDNLIAWFKFDHTYDTGNSALDTSGKGRHATLSNGASISEEDQILSLDGTNDEATIADYKGITGTSPRSISIWMKKENSDRNNALVSWGTNSSGEKYTFRTQEGDGNPSTIRIEVNGGYVVGSTNILDNNWHHVAVTWENDGTPNVTDSKLYVDGEQETNSATQSETMDTGNSLDLTIGNDHSSRYYSSDLDDARIYDRALTAAEIRTIYQQGR